MRFPKRDVIATGAVAVAVVLYLLWLADVTLPGMSDLRVTGLVVLVFGFVASAVAVVPGFEQLMHGNKVYLAATSLIGLAALVAGVVMLWSESSAAFAVLMVALVVLWAIATTHHVLLAKTGRPAATGESAAPSRPAQHASVR
jgi:hypothetical protein